MRSLKYVDEFRREAQNALFTRQQALAITIQLLQKELKDDANSQNEVEILTNAISTVNMRYLDATQTETDVLLDTFNVPRLTSEDILSAIDAIIFDAK